MSINSVTQIDFTKANLLITGLPGSGKSRTLNIIKDAIKAVPHTEMIQVDGNHRGVIRRGEQIIRERILRERATAAEARIEGFKATDEDPHLVLIFDDIDLSYHYGEGAKRATRQLFNKLLNVMAVGPHGGVTVIAVGADRDLLEKAIGGYCDHRLDLQSRCTQGEAYGVFDGEAITVQLPALEAAAA